MKKSKIRLKALKEKQDTVDRAHYRSRYLKILQNILVTRCYSIIDITKLQKKECKGSFAQKTELRHQLNNTLIQCLTLGARLFLHWANWRALDQHTADVCVFFTCVKTLICLHDFRITVPIFS